jgi:hypothetical protein
LKNQSINWQTKFIINFLLFTKTILPNFVVELPGSFFLLFLGKISNYC